MAKEWEKGTNLEVLKMKREEILKQQKKTNNIQRSLGNRMREVERLIRQHEEKDLEQKTGVTVYRASDYAGLSCGEYKFYYGYEETEGDEWCFTADVDGKEVMRIPESQLQQKDVLLNLLHGIGQFLNRGDEDGSLRYLP